MDDKLLTVGGVDYYLTPSFKNLKRIQDRLGEKIFTTARRIYAQQYGPDDIATILWCMIDGKPKEIPEFDDFAESIFRCGFTNFLEPVVELLDMILTGGEEKKKEAGEGNR